MIESLDPKQTGHLKEPVPLTRILAQTRINGWLQGEGDAYARINALRNWINGNFFPAFELYLEDVWNDPNPGETRFEYILRSKQTLNETEMLAQDVYENRCDSAGVWHLGDYVRTDLFLADAEELLAFLSANGHRWPEAEEKEKAGSP